jgi:hypothetical protein
MLLGMPGIVAYLIICKITTKRKGTQLDSLLQIFLLSILSYSLLSGFYLILANISGGRISIVSPLERLIGSISSKTKEPLDNKHSRRPPGLHLSLMHIMNADQPEFGDLEA